MIIAVQDYQCAIHPPLKEIDNLVLAVIEGWVSAGTGDVIVAENEEALEIHTREVLQMRWSP